MNHFETQLANETSFYTNLKKISDEGLTAIAATLNAQGPVQAGAVAAAIAVATPLEIQSLKDASGQLTTAESNFGKDTGTAYGTGLVQGIGSKLSDILIAGTAAGTALHTGATTALAAHSPSLLAQQLAQDYAAGLVLGLQLSTPLVASAAGQLASALVVSPNAPALATGTTVAATGTAAGAPGSVIQNVVVNEVAQNPAATAFAVSSRLATQAMR